MDWRERPYHRIKSYGDSKLANVLFAQGLQSRLVRAGSDALSLLAHPGLTGTERQQSIGVGGLLARWLAAPVACGVAPQLRAATDPDARAGDFYGPRWGVRGPACKVELKPMALNRQLVEALWQYTEQLTSTRPPDLGQEPLPSS